VILGRFSPTEKKCGRCNRVYETYEEKETDVNLSSRVVRDAVLGGHAALYLLTGDSDQVATIKTIHELQPGLEAVSVFPPRRRSAELKKVADRQIRLTMDHFLKNQLPNPIVLRSGAELRCPESWLLLS
jgi:hypothetical protein